MPSGGRIAVWSEGGLGETMGPTGSTADTVSEVGYNGSSSDFWN